MNSSMGKQRKTMTEGEYGGRAKNIVSFCMFGFQDKHNCWESVQK